MVSVEADSTLVQVGGALQARVTDLLPGETVQYRSRNGQLAQVDGNGIITGVEAGDTAIDVEVYKNGILQGSGSLSILVYVDLQNLSVFNAALNKPAFAFDPSGTVPLTPNQPMSNGVDGNLSTVTSAAGYYAWQYRVDMGSLVTAQSIAVQFHIYNYATEYEILTINGVTWEVLDHNAEGTPGVKLTSTLSAPKAMRYIAIKSLKPDAAGQPGAQMAIAELEVAAYALPVPRVLAFTANTTIVQTTATMATQLSGLAVDETVEYVSNDRQIASVDANGIVLGVSHGSTAIKALVYRNHLLVGVGSLLVTVYDDLNELSLENAALGKQASAWGSERNRTAGTQSPHR